MPFEHYLPIWGPPEPEEQQRVESMDIDAAVRWARAHDPQAEAMGEGSHTVPTT